jgi:antitoxin component YwqK of YwqJK toxin-antitoxin module
MSSKFGTKKLINTMIDIQIKITLITIIYFLGLITPSFGQIYTKAIDLKVYNSYDYFLSCKENYDLTFNGIDTIKSVDYKGQKITLFLYIEKGLKKKAVAFYDNDQKCRETNFDGLNRNGIDIEWYKKGNISFMGYFEHGLAKSPLLSWHKNGVLAISSLYLSKNRCIHKGWSESGRLIGEDYPTAQNMALY